MAGDDTRIDSLSVDLFDAPLDPGEADALVRREGFGTGARAQALPEAEDLLQVLAGGVLGDQETKTIVQSELPVGIAVMTQRGTKCLCAHQRFTAGVNCIGRLLYERPLLLHQQSDTRTRIREPMPYSVASVIQRGRCVMEKQRERDCAVQEGTTSSRRHTK